MFGVKVDFYEQREMRDGGEGSHVACLIGRKFGAMLSPIRAGLASGFSSFAKDLLL